MEIIIEEISRGHKLLGRHKLNNQQVNIGRSYSNDIILSDPHICPTHLSILFDGEHWIIRDNDSINGTYLEDDNKSADHHIIRSGDVFSIGKSLIRIVFPNHPVAESIKLSPYESLIDFTRNPAILLTSIFIFACVAGYVFYLNDPKDVSLSKYLVPAIGTSLLFAIWPSAVALISHLSKHEARVMSQLGVSFAFFNLMWISDVIESIVDFNLSGNWSITPIITLIPIGLAYCLFWLNCYIGFHMSARRRVVIATSLTTLLFGGSFLIQYTNKPEFNIRPQYNATLMTPVFAITTGTSIEDFVADSERLFNQAQQEITKEK